MLTSSLVACEGVVMFRDGDRVRGTLRVNNDRGIFIIRKIAGEDKVTVVRDSEVPRKENHFVPQDWLALWHLHFLRKLETA
jgi:hypothetical protein